MDWDSFNTATPDWEDRVPTTPVVVSEALARALHNRDDFADVTGRAPDLITSSEVDLTPLTAKALESDSLDKGSRASDRSLPRTVRFGDISRARRCCVACMHALRQPGWQLDGGCARVPMPTFGALGRTGLTRVRCCR